MSKLNIASYDPYTQAHGPGNRFALWVQGCNMRCPGCINDHMLDTAEDKGKKYETTDLSALVARQANGVRPIEGVTVMGGEPTLQAQALADLLISVKAQGLNVLLFSGYTIEQLRARQSAAINNLLEQVDTLIDGPFIAAKLDTKLIRGSTNQRIIHLTDTLQDRDFSRKGAGLFITNEPNGGVSLHQSGFDLSPLAA